MTKYFTLMLSLILSVCLVKQANATTWYVHPDSSLNTIQAGLDSCSAGDTVLVAPGTYQDTLTWPSTPGIDLISELGPDVTVIDAKGYGRVITMAQYLTAETIIDGFTIMNGWATGSHPDDYGAGIYCLNTSPMIRNNVITANYAYSNGGGIYCQNSSPRIIGNIIHNNGTTIGRGGGISCYDEAEAVIWENNFYYNSAEHGGAIDCYENSEARIEYNEIISNNATFGGGVRAGYGTWEHNSLPPTHYNNISGNGGCGMYSNNHSDWGYLPGENNWWGHADGPSAGDCVSGPVTYNPWLTEEIVFDIEVVSIEAPPDTVIPGNIYTPRIIVRNNCNYNYPVSFFTARCTINGSQDYVRINQSIPQDSTREVTFADWVPVGEYPVDYIMSVELFYAVDQDSTNDTISKEIYYTDVEDIDIISSSLSFTLSQNYPNPFNPTTQIEYTLKKGLVVQLTIHNILGHKVTTLVDEFQCAGLRQVRWDGTDDKGRRLGSGIYFYRLKVGDFVESRKMVLLK
jgi:hypothetical protein